MKTFGCFAGLLAVVVCGAAGAQAPDADQSWTCVPGDNGRWRCGEGAAEPETSPLPELPEPEAAAPPPSIFDPEQAHGTPTDAEPTIPAGHPLLGDANPAGPFALKIASVSRAEEVPGFVENYGLDPTLVRYVAVEEGGSTRQLILWGAFTSATQASRAVNGLPGIVRQVRPQVVRTDRFDQPPRMLPAAAAPATSGTLAAVAPDTREPAPERAAVPPATAPEPPVQIAAREAEPESAEAAPADAEPAPRVTASAPEPTPVPLPSPAVNPDPAPRIAAGGPEAEPEAAVTAPPAAEPTIPRAEPEPTVAASEAVTLRPRAAVAAAAQPPPQRLSTAPTAARTGANPASSPGAVAGPPPGRTAAELRALAADGYTVQLTSLRDAALIERFLRHHGLDPTRVYRIRVDEGAGPRWLLLWDWYPSLERAQAGRDALPASIRSPWVRRVAPLIERPARDG